MPSDDGTAWDRAAELDSIKATYERYRQTDRARLWDAGSPGYARLVRSLQEEVLAALKRSVSQASATVLDLGCGTGDLIGVATTAGIEARWIGVDLRPEAVDAARAAYPQATFLTGSADRVPLPNHSVDVVVAQVLFSSLPSRSMERAVAAEIARLLRPDGWLVWLDLRYSNPRNRAVHGLSDQRVRELFSGWMAELRPSGLLPPIARRLAWITPVAFPILTGIPPLQSHLVGRLKRPRQTVGG